MTTPDIPKQLRGKNADPEFRRERCRKAAAVRLSVSVAVRRIVDRSSELTEEERQQLAAVLADGA